MIQTGQPLMNKRPKARACSLILRDSRRREEVVRKKNYVTISDNTQDKCVVCQTFAFLKKRLIRAATGKICSQIRGQSEVVTVKRKFTSGAWASVSDGLLLFPPRHSSWRPYPRPCWKSRRSGHLACRRFTVASEGRLRLREGPAWQKMQPRQRGTWASVAID